MAYDTSSILGLKLPLPGDVDEDFDIRLRAAFQKVEVGFGLPVAWETAPTLLGDGGNPTCTYADRKGYVMRRGNEVFVHGYINLSAISGGSGILGISLPYRAANLSLLFPVLEIGQIGGYTASLANVKNLALRITPNTSKALLLCSNGSNSPVAEAVSTISSSFNMLFSGRYYTDESL